MRVLMLLLCLFALHCQAQRTIDKNYELRDADIVKLYFEWPELITVRYHDENSVRVQGEVSINHGQYDDRFSLSSEIKEDKLIIKSSVDRMEEMDEVTVVVKNKERIYFSQGSIYRVTTEEDKGEYISKGVIMDILLTIYLPRDIPAVIDAKYGVVELHEINGQLKVNSKFGGVDASFSNDLGIKLTAGTRFGEIYTDLPVNFQGKGMLRNEDNWHRLKADINGSDMPLDIISKFGNIYLRKAKE